MFLTNPYGTLDAILTARWMLCDALCISVLSCIITDVCLILLILFDILFASLNRFESFLLSF